MTKFNQPQGYDLANPKLYEEERIKQEYQENIEEILYVYCCKKRTAKETKKKLKELKASVDLRTWINNEIDVFSLSGNFLFTAET